MRRHLSALLTAGLLISASAHGSPGGSPKPTQRELNQANLFLAMTMGKYADVKAALKPGVDPNGRDFISFLPLFFSGDIPTSKLLIEHGAKINEETVRGTPLVYALLTHNDKLGMWLMDKGAKPTGATGDGRTALMTGSFTGTSQSVRRLLKKGVDVNQRTLDGETALSFAARGNQLEIAKILLDAGAKVDLADNLNRTPLHHAALQNFDKMASLLLARGAAAAAVDSTGATPLHLAAHYSDTGAAIPVLLAAGASKDAKDGHGKTPLELASRRECATAIQYLGAPAVDGPEPDYAPDPSRVQLAVKPALTLIQASMKAYEKKADCISCHHQGLGSMALGQATAHHFAVDSKLLNRYLKQIGDDYAENLPAIQAANEDMRYVAVVPSVHLGDYSYEGGYFFEALIKSGVPSNAKLADSTLLMGRTQDPTGFWRGDGRGTMQHSNFTNTAQVLDVMRNYWPATRQGELQQRIGMAKKWILTAKPEGSEDLASRLTILQKVGASQAEISEAAQELMKAQLPDGGWGLPKSPISDAFTTGVSLCALRTAAHVPSSDKQIQKAVAYLLRTQDEDGSWYVAKATVAFNNHFDAGFPHGYDQFASFAGTCWATMGLMETLDR